MAPQAEPDEGKNAMAANVVTPGRPGVLPVTVGDVSRASIAVEASVSARPNGVTREEHPRAVVGLVLGDGPEVALASDATSAAASSPPASAVVALSSVTANWGTRSAAQSSTWPPSVDVTLGAVQIGSSACGGRGKRRRSWSPQMAVLPTAYLTDLPLELLGLVVKHLCMADRLALSATSSALQSACDDDSIYERIGWAVLGVGATTAERRAWGLPNVSHRQPPLIDRLLSAQQGRAIVNLLRAMNTLSRTWDGLGLSGMSGMNLLGWIDHFLTYHPAGLTNQHRPVGRGGCRSCIRYSVTTRAVVRLWGISLTGSTAEDDCWEWTGGPDGHREVAYNLWAVLRMAFFHTGPPTPEEPAPFDGSWGMPVALSVLRYRARRAAEIRRLALAHVQGGWHYAAPGALRRPGRPNFCAWVEMAFRSARGPLALYFDGVRSVRAPDMVSALKFLAEVYDGVVAEWPGLAFTHRCALHWPVLERHVVGEAVKCSANGRSDATAVAEAVEHAACVGVSRLCMAWGRRAGLAAVLQPGCTVRWPVIEPEGSDESTTDGGEDSATESGEDAFSD